LTATARANATPPIEIYNNATKDNPSFSMNAQDNIQQWDQNSLCMFTNGRYQIINALLDQYTPCMAKGTNLKNFAYQAVMTFSSDGDGGGLIFRADRNLKNFYRFSLDSQGLYHFFLCQQCADYSLASGILLTEKSIANNTKPIGQDNILTVIVLNTTLYLYVNARFVEKLDVSAITSSGEMGLYAYSASPPTTVTFSNVKVWKLPDNGQLS